MKRVVSISIGSSRRDKAAEIELLGERIHLERIGTDGDMERAARLFQELDGQVDAFGVGGADLGCRVDQKWYPLYSVRPMVRYIQQTPVVDGGGLKNTLERQLAPLLDARLGDQVTPRRALVTSGAGAWRRWSCPLPAACRFIGCTRPVTSRRFAPHVGVSTTRGRK